MTEYIFSWPWRSFPPKVVQFPAVSSLNQRPVIVQSIPSRNLQPIPDYCSLPRRLLAMLYDAFILLGLLMLAAALALPFGNPQKIAFQDFWFTLWLLLVCFAYLGGCWRYGGMTVGMRAWRVKLISRNGATISWPRCLLRFIAASIALAAFGLGFLWALFDQQKRGWHDIIGHTVLIKTPKVSNKL